MKLTQPVSSTVQTNLSTYQNRGVALTFVFIKMKNINKLSDNWEQYED